MKKTLLLAYTALLFAYLLPVLFRDRPAETAPPAPDALPLPAETDAPEASAPRAEPSPLPRTIRVLCGDEVVEMALEDYLVGVVAAEMPVSFPGEALKAQAVAARSYALYCAAGHKHADAEVCTDPGCCQAWLSEDRLRENWGGDYAQNLALVRAAVEATAGETLRYKGEPIFAAFHSSSAGATEDSGAVWNPQPYLISVDSPETAGDVPGYISTLLCAPIDFRDVILSAYPEADFSGEAAAWVGPLRRDASGRVESVELGGVAVPGKALRQLFSLRSTAFTLSCTEKGFLFTVTGYGHGVGMSQYGAAVMAREGADYRQILAHYYPGAELAPSLTGP